MSKYAYCPPKRPKNNHKDAKAKDKTSKPFKRGYMYNREELAGVTETALSYVEKSLESIARLEENLLNAQDELCILRDMIEEKNPK